MTICSDGDTQTLEKADAFALLEEEWNVVFYDDDETTFEFVICLLQAVFHMGEKRAFQLTQRIHVEGRGVAGTFPLAIATEKTDASRRMARSAGYPLRIEMERPG